MAEVRLDFNVENISSVNDAANDIRRLTRVVEQNNDSIEELRDSLNNLDFNTRNVNAARNSFQQLARQEQELANNTNSLNASLTTMNSAVTGAGEGVSTLTALFPRASRAAQGFQTRLTALATHPIVAVFAATAAILIGLGKAFATTTRGAEFFNRVGDVLAGTMGVLQSVLNDVVEGLVSFGTATVDAFNFVDSGIQTASSSIGRLNDLFTGFFTSLIDNASSIFGSLGTIIKGALTLDTTTLNDGLTELNTSFTNLTSQAKANADAITEDRAAKVANKQATDANKDANDGLFGSMTNVFRVARELSQAQRQLTRELAANERAIRSIEAANSILETTANDSTLSLTQQLEATRELSRGQEEAAALRVEGARRTLELTRLEFRAAEQNGTLQQELRDRLGEAEVAYTTTVAEQTNIRLQNQQLERQILSDITEQELDVYIDLVQGQIDANTRLIDDDRTTSEERARLITENNRLRESSFTAQVAALEESAGREIDIQRLLQIEDAETLAQEVKNTGLSEVLTTRLIEVLNERRRAEQDAATEKETAEQKKRNQIEATRKAEEEAAQERQRQIQDELNGITNNSRAQDMSFQERRAALNSLVEQGDISNEVFASSVAQLNQQQVQFYAEIAGSALSNISSISDSILQSNLARIDREQEADEQALQERFDRGLITEEELQEGLTSIEEEANEERVEAERRAFLLNKGIRLAEAAINGALAITNIIATAPIPSQPFLIAAAATTTAVQTALIASQEFPEQFGTGGVITESGLFHSQGGNDREFAGHKFNDEKGEMLSIFSRKAVSKHGNLINDFTHALNNGIDPSILFNENDISNVVVNSGNEYDASMYMLLSNVYGLMKGKDRYEGNTIHLGNNKGKIVKI